MPCLAARASTGSPVAPCLLVASSDHGRPLCHGLLGEVHVSFCLCSSRGELLGSSAAVFIDANNMKTLLIQKTINLDFDQNVEFDVTVPNVSNFPHKNRCVVMIDTLSISAVMGPAPTYGCVRS